MNKSESKNKYHYAFRAACQLETCRKRLQDTGSDDALLDLEDVLLSIERLLHAYFVHLIEFERQALLECSAEAIDEDDMDSIPGSLDESMRVLTDVMELRSKLQPQQIDSTPRVSFSMELNKTKMPRSEQMAGDSSTSSGGPSFENTRSVTDSLLFRLIVTLQLCLLRINDVRNLIGGNRDDGVRFHVFVASAACLGTTVIYLRPYLQTNRQGTLGVLSKVSIAAVSLTFIYRWWMRLWMVGKLSKSTVILEQWREQWIQSGAASSSNSDTKTQKMIEFVKNQNPKMSFWQSEGELRFLVLKRAMDLLYASVGTALEVTKPNRPFQEGPSWQTSVTAMAAASYLNVIGPNKRAAQAVNESSSELIQNAWGMVSLPAIKLLSLRATRLLKRAALAERIIIAGVPCFILSKDPCPNVIVSLKRFARQERRRSGMTRLSTIDEQGTSRRQRSNSITLKQMHVIFHLTGGGFFAHTLASDLPYLLDWSKTTGAMVICPEYALLPDHTFPAALDDITRVYSSLLNGSASLQLGFDVNRIVVTGESAGGNLAAAMCVKLGMSMPHDNSSGEYADQEVDQVRLPDALMLSCPVLNLSLELSPSRVIGDKDPVLPSGLISAISDAYAPVSKQDPLVSPLYAPDEMLRKFPPTLLFCSSDDPLLDDSVHFNTRLRLNGVESDLRAAHNMPHAYWGLGTAGFPEAQQVQVECEEFLKEKLEQQQ